MKRTIHKAFDLGNFYQSYHCIFDTKHYYSLSLAARAVLHGICCQYNGKNNGELTATAIQAKQWGLAKATLVRSLKELEEKHFLIKTKQGLFASGKNQPNLFALTWLKIDIENGDIKKTYSPFRTAKEIIEGKNFDC